MVSAERFRDPMEILAEQFLSELRNGRPVTVDQYASRRAEMAHEIRQLFPTLLELELMKAEELDAPPSPSMVAGKRRLGDFRLIREIGRGGMGVVYEAVQESLGRTVALKVLSPALLNSASPNQRLVREAQAAARLHHTNIVPVFGSGQHETTFFYVMQFIDGIGFDEVLADANLTKERRLRRRWKTIARNAADLASALHYAHEHGVFHRDIKPSNIILDRDGKVWIADFGLAKAVEHDALTTTGDTVGTLRYMAPEQLDGRADERTDIFGLGLTLYELLAWQPAYGESDRGSLLRCVAEGSPVPPRRIDPGIPKDLETIVLKAIAPDPRSRYSSAGEMAEDLQRFVDDLPVHARRITPLESAWRWSKRNRAVSILGCTTLLLSLAMTFVSWIALARTNNVLSQESEQRKQAVVQKQQAEDQRSRAESNLKLALSQFDAIFAVLADDQPAGTAEAKAGESATLSLAMSQDVSQVLERLLQFYKRFVQENGEHPEFRRQLILAHGRVGDIHRQLGQFDEAKLAYQQALTFIAEQPQVEDGVETASLKARLGSVYCSAGKIQSALREYHDATTILFRQLDHKPHSQAALFELAKTHERRADLFFIEGSRREQEREIRFAVELFEELVALAFDNPEYRFHLAAAYHQRHVAHLADHTSLHTTQDGDNAIELLSALAEHYPGMQKYRYLLSKVYAADLTPSQDNTSDSLEKQLRKAVSLSRRLVQENPALPEYVLLHGRNLAKLGQRLDQQGDTQEAEVFFRRAVSRHQDISRRFANVPMYQDALAETQHQLGKFLIDHSRDEEARPLLESSIQLRKKFLESANRNRQAHASLANGYNLLARALSESGEAHLANQALTLAQEQENHIKSGGRHGEPHRPPPRFHDIHHPKPPPHHHGNHGRKHR